jgi:hypothetical protein
MAASLRKPAVWTPGDGMFVHAAIDGCSRPYRIVATVVCRFSCSPPTVVARICPRRALSRRE